jgi:hypothetical protein
MSLRRGLEDLVKEWESMAKGTTQFDATLRVAALKVREVLDAHPEHRTITEWGSGFAETGAIYNHHYTQREAEVYVESMNKVGAQMIVMSREHTPMVATAWAPVA